LRGWFFSAYYLRAEGGKGVTYIALILILAFSYHLGVYSGVDSEWIGVEHFFDFFEGYREGGGIYKKKKEGNGGGEED